MRSRGTSYAHARTRAGDAKMPLGQQNGCRRKREGQRAAHQFKRACEYLDQAKRVIALEEACEPRVNQQGAQQMNRRSRGQRRAQSDG